MQIYSGTHEKSTAFQAENDRRFCFESYGVRFRIESNSRELLRNAERVVRKALLDRIEILENVPTSVGHVFVLGEDSRGQYYLIDNGAEPAYRESDKLLLKYFNTLLRLKVAEFAVDRVFIHAGVVSWRGKAIVIPGRSFDGKTTLVASLVKAGALYMSDEYAVLDAEGLVHPFPRDLSVRYFDGAMRQKDVSIDTLGGVTSVEPAPIGVLLLTKYQFGSHWKPEILTVGQGTIETVQHTIPIRFNPEFSLKVLKTSLRRAIIARSLRGDASRCARKILAFFDDHIDIMNAT